MKNICKIIVPVLCAATLFHYNILAQQVKDGEKTVTLTSVVVDQEGNPVPNAIVYGNEGSRIARTGSDGSFSITVTEQTPLLVEAPGYASVKITPVLSVIPAETVLKGLPYQMAETDDVNIPFGTLKRRHLSGSVSVLNPGELLDHDARQDVYSALNGRVPGLFGNQNVYGLGNAVFVVDGIPRPPFFINLQEVSQITVLKDAPSRNLYGAQADVPVVLITTKRGQAYKRQLNVRLETGLQNPISFPNYLGAADYMTLYNEALDNDNRAPRYDSLTIANTRNKLDPALYPDEDYFNSTYLKNMKNYYRLITESSGGNEVATYYAYLGWSRNEGLMALGRGDRQDNINLRGNVDYQINDYMKMRFDGVTTFVLNRGYNGDFWGNASTFIPNQAPVLVPVTDSALLATASLIDGKYILGGTSVYQTNIYGDLVSAGYKNSLARVLQFNTGLDFDLNFIAEGLTARTFLTFDLYNYYETQLLNTYAVYEPRLVSGTNGDSLTYIKTGLDIRQGNESLINPFSYRRIGIYGTLNYHKIINNTHEINATGVAYRDQIQVAGEIHQGKNLHFGLQANYSYRNRYLAQVSTVVAGSPRFSEENRYAFSPALSLGWILTEEDFMDSGFFDFLKVRAGWGLIHTDAGFADYYLYQTNYTQGAWFDYNHGVVRNRVRNIASVGNPDIEWVKRQQWSAGFEALVMNRSLMLEGGYFRSRLYDVLTTRTNFYPQTIGTLPLENYNAYLNNGMEFGLNYTRKLGEIDVSLGSNLVYAVPKVLQMDEPVYEWDYLVRTGKPTDARFGWVALGLFRDWDEINDPSTPVQTFGEVRPGDIRYKDLNEDGVIDDNDVEMIGYSSARFQYSLNLRLNYRMFELFVIGTGQTGQSSYFTNQYYWVYGERKYSEVVLDRWTPETAETATYPRLSSTNNSNNFRNSTFWLYDNNWFTLHAVQLNMSLPYRLVEKSFLKGLQVYLRGSNLLTISPIREKKELNIGSEPQYRLYAIGLNASF